ncbi:hypothetical protein QZH41_005984 [Actinostola sp. cb2023]|nr:hypothetical protein QZH41_005984 [Actinostola sp. cb2023]
MMLLITIGLNRHQAIVHPLRGMTYRTANKLIVGAWLYSLIVVAPSIYLTRVQFYTNSATNTTEPYCATIPVSTKLGLSYVLSLAFFGYVIPLTTLLVLYSKISYSVWRRNAEKSALRTSRPAAAMLRTRKKVIKMFLTVILVFVVTWLPLIIYVGVLETMLGGAKRFSYVRLTLYSIGLSNSIYNPFIYSFFNKRFRQGCKSIFKRSARIMTKKTADRREAVREKHVSRPVKVPETIGKQNDKDSPIDEWTNKFSAQVIRDHNGENAFEERDSVILINVKYAGEKQTDKQTGPADSSEVINGNHGYHSSAPNHNPTGQNTDILQTTIDTPSGSIHESVKQETIQDYSKVRKRPKLFKTFSVDPTLNPTPKHDKPKLRKTTSNVEPMHWINDFENIF